MKTLASVLLTSLAAGENRPLKGNGGVAKSVYQGSRASGFAETLAEASKSSHPAAKKPEGPESVSKTVAAVAAEEPSGTTGDGRLENSDEVSVLPVKATQPVSEVSEVSEAGVGAEAGAGNDSSGDKENTVVVDAWLLVETEKNENVILPAGTSISVVTETTVGQGASTRQIAEITVAKVASRKVPGLGEQNPAAPSGAEDGAPGGAALSAKAAARDGQTGNCLAGAKEGPDGAGSGEKTLLTDTPAREPQFSEASLFAGGGSREPDAVGYGGSENPVAENAAGPENFSSWARLRSEDVALPDGGQGVSPEFDAAFSPGVVESESPAGAALFAGEESVEAGNDGELAKTAENLGLSAEGHGAGRHGRKERAWRGERVVSQKMHFDNSRSLPEMPERAIFQIRRDYSAELSGGEKTASASRDGVVVQGENRGNGILWLQEQARQNQSVNLRLDESAATVSESAAAEDEALSLTAAAEKKRNELFPFSAEVYAAGREKVKTGGGAVGNHEIGAGAVAVKDNSAKTAAAPSRVPSLPVSDENLLDQIKNGLTRGIQGRQTVTIRLWPENLGKVEVRLVLKEQQMTATFTVEQAEVKEALLRKVEGLRDGLGLRGIEVKDIEVKVATVKSGGSPELFLQDQNRGHADFRHRRDQEAFSQTGAGVRGSNVPVNDTNDSEVSSGRMARGNPLFGLTEASGSLYIMA